MWHTDTLMNLTALEYAINKLLFEGFKYNILNMDTVEQSSSYCSIYSFSSKQFGSDLRLAVLSTSVTAHHSPETPLRSSNTNFKCNSSGEQICCHGLPWLCRNLRAILAVWTESATRGTCIFLLKLGIQMFISHLPWGLMSLCMDIVDTLHTEFCIHFENQFDCDETV